ncbi:hypothetical protein AVEN_40947-1 [Araneus ventricosus]|uniref:Peptidase aspartic putative domain-containing protein n=1 Tax=Araneus ventricosus TaxID=182803 RepID=A0A4Y2FC99_ARAVE|nr:hypothetical protein AVEN_40947-1 [Araneus ventricosus]
METLVQLRGTYRGCFTKFIEKVEVFLKTEVDDSDLYVSHLSQLTEKYTKIQHLNDKILKLIQGKDRCTERDICNEIESAESYEDKFIFWKTKLERCISRADSGIDTQSVSESISNKRNFKLPKIELQKFYGSLKDWLSFWGLFKKIAKDSDIPNEDKYQYLIQSTLKGSRAREVVESFPPSAENYTQAIECLKERFGREDVLVEVYVRELLSLVLNNVFNNEHKLPLIKLYDRIETQLRSLQMLGVTSDKYASMLYPLIESCLPIDLLRIWERHLSSITFKSDEKFNKLETLMKFLGKEIEGEEKINLAKTGFGGERSKVKIRAIIDSTSQRSYILNSTAQRLNYQPHRRESRRHSLFGGTSTEICHNDVYRAFLTDVSLTYNCNFEVLGQEAICATIPPVADGSWIKELSENNIHLSDQRHGPIELLIGADVAGKLLTGGYKLLPSGLVAIETRLGWTVMLC